MKCKRRKFKVGWIINDRCSVRLQLLKTNSVFSEVFRIIYLFQNTDCKMIFWDILIIAITTYKTWNRNFELEYYFILWRPRITKTKISHVEFEFFSRTWVCKKYNTFIQLMYCILTSSAQHVLPPLRHSKP